MSVFDSGWGWEIVAAAALRDMQAAHDAATVLEKNWRAHLTMLHRGTWLLDNNVSGLKKRLYTFMYMWWHLSLPQQHMLMGDAAASAVLVRHVPHM